MRSRVVTVAHTCEGCHYWRCAGEVRCCHYALVEGHLRGCSVDDCNKRKPYDASLAKTENRAQAQLNYGVMYESSFCLS